jgi:hypothetical protein
MLAAGLMIFAAIAGASFFMLRPNSFTTLSSIDGPRSAKPPPACLGCAPDRPQQRSQRQRSHAADRHDKIPTPYSITLSALAESVAGTASPSVLVVLRLMDNSNLEA